MTKHDIDKFAFTAIVHGRVQGVAFRYYTRDKATRLGLLGWVRNLSDGSVELFAQGERTKLEELKEWLQIGPPSAIVKRVTTTECEPNDSYRSFEITF